MAITNDRITLKFYDKQFWETLDKWKKLCKFLKGGQTERIMKIISEDLPNLKKEIADKDGINLR